MKRIFRLSDFLKPKHCLFGVCDNISINFNKIKVWALSFQNVCKDKDVCLICLDATDEEIKMCESIGIKAFKSKLDKDSYGDVNHKRLEPARDFIKSSSYEYFLITDVFDVLFQQDPFKKLDFDAYDVFAGQEGVLVNEEPWNFDNIKKLFPDKIGSCVGHPVVCSGIIAGKKEALIPVYEKMFDMCQNESTDEHAIKDQAAFIVMISNNLIPNLKLFSLNDAWAVHCAVAGPTNLFEGWGFKNKLLSSGLSLPKLISGQIKSGDELFDIVHQFNRIPDWESELIKDYINE